MKINNILINIVFILFLLAAFSGSPALATEPPPQGFKQDALTIVTAKATQRFSIELAETPQQQEYGLMHRKTMARDHGMLFLMPRSIDAHFWMKDTEIPLDMLFIDAHGHIVHIAPNAAPYSLAPISAGQPVRAVLELLGGTADADGIKPGDAVIHPAFKP